HIRSTTVDGLFSGQYVGPLEDYQKVIVQGDGATPKLNNISGPAKVMQSWIYQNMTDLWGDIPYSEALTGDAATPILKPKYDTQQSIYTGMLASLTAAATSMAPGVTVADPGYGAADILYGGD